MLAVFGAAVLAPAPGVEAAISIANSDRAAPQSAPGRAPRGVFGSTPIEIGGLPEARKWREVKERWAAQRSVAAACWLVGAACGERFAQWRRHIDRIAALAPAERVAAVNTLFNRMMRPADDRRLYGRDDYWATPYESLRGYGDCEDIALAKIFALIDLGFDPAQISLVVVRDERRRAVHAVAGLHVGERVLVLDAGRAVVADLALRGLYAPLRSYRGERAFVHARG